MLVLGIDTGLVNTGVAVIEEGVARTRCTLSVEGDSEDTGPRYVKLREGLELFSRRVLRRALRALVPAVVVIEQPELGIRKDHDAASVLKLYGAFAVTYAECARLWPQAHLMGVLPAQWKGSMKKSLTAGIMRAKYRVECRNEHEWDALGLADYAWDVARARRREAERKKELTGAEGAGV